VCLDGLEKNNITIVSEFRWLGKGERTMPIVLDPKYRDYEKAGYIPFVCIIKWEPAERDIAIKKLSQVFKTPEGKGIKGIHGWNLIGRNTMILIGWTNSHISLQKFYTSNTYGTGISMDICPAIDQFGLRKALEELETQIPNNPFSKADVHERKNSKARQ
jgi:hypothetical protein